MSKRVIIRIAIALGVIAFLAVNLICWSVGVGGGRQGGTELDRYFGWPACYRAETWASSDPALASRILKKAPFFDPRADMTRRVRHISVLALVVDALFFAAAIALATIVWTSIGHRARALSWVFGACLAVALLILYMVVDQLSVYL